MLFVIVATAATPPDFSGEWKLDREKSSPAVPATLVRSIQHKDPALTFTERGNTILYGDLEPTFKYTTDGKDSPNNVAGHDLKGAAAWEDSTLVIRMTGNFGQGDIAVVDKWSLSNGSQILTDVQHINSPNGQFDLTYVFSKR